MVKRGGVYIRLGGPWRPFVRPSVLLIPHFLFMFIQLSVNLSILSMSVLCLLVAVQQSKPLLVDWLVGRSVQIKLFGLLMLKIPFIHRVMNLYDRPGGLSDANPQSLLPLRDAVQSIRLHRRKLPLLRAENATGGR